MARRGFFTENEKKLLKLLVENPEIGPTEIAKAMGWKHSGTARWAVIKLKNKVKNLEEAEEYLKALGITPRDIEKL
ncbi:hypothetical protein AKJ43_03665 [candidate division MSBL1 archaeon SCGC-AAA261D19]|uniref:Uncharacterized protein n=1 Tax=candidate division MSBL1 archaeon SCGC-AAA261D19 TaxID=1698273 RepID=A0A133V3T5_9EURY|nr:hypothetical protein AKJ43_03665 [candidate division MSBL1 archaeon SCGC-AAA261D19]